MPVYQNNRMEGKGNKDNLPYGVFYDISVESVYIALIIAM